MIISPIRRQITRRTIPYDDKIRECGKQGKENDVTQISTKSGHALQDPS